jgi:hypothetical protein
MSDVNGEMIDKREARRRKLYAIAREHQLTRTDRIDLAEFMLRRDIESWKDLSDGEITRLLDAFEGYELITYQLYPGRTERLRSLRRELVAHDGLDAEGVLRAVGASGDDVAGGEEPL